MAMRETYYELPLVGVIVYLECSGHGVLGIGRARQYRKLDVSFSGWERIRTKKKKKKGLHARSFHSRSP